MKSSKRTIIMFAVMVSIALLVTVYSASAYSVAQPKTSKALFTRKT